MIDQMIFFNVKQLVLRNIEYCFKFDETIYDYWLKKLEAQF